ncbi:hypothetical protein [Shimazuella alba]|uniref:Uncharacterized protein n=1 Tax=Shimazuella alba TaxID=2690964 RepID=A0A6I4VSR7_9BACL|nr:hypothetical protein [Shimazuella alba]MXQ53255.1 hypothetical protein [Shimazuella alba]
MAQTDNTRPEYIRVAEANFRLYETLTERICNTTARELKSLLKQGVLTLEDVDFIKELEELNKHTLYRVCKYMLTPSVYNPETKKYESPHKRFEVAFSVTFRKDDQEPLSHKKRGYLNPKAQKKEQNRRLRRDAKREIAEQLALHDELKDYSDELYDIDPYDYSIDSYFDDEYDDARYDGDCLNDPFYGDPFYDDPFGYDAYYDSLFGNAYYDSLYRDSFGDEYSYRAGMSYI